jgi:hypothetical protein
MAGAVDEGTRSIRVWLTSVKSEWRTLRGHPLLFIPCNNPNMQWTFQLPKLDAINLGGSTINLGFGQFLALVSILQSHAMAS